MKRLLFSCLFALTLGPWAAHANDNFIVSKFQQDPASSVPVYGVPGSTVNLNVCTKNIGTVSFPTLLTSPVELRVDDCLGSTCSSLKSASIPPPSLGWFSNLERCTIVTISIPSRTTHRRRELRVLLDPNQKITETSKTDNSARLLYYVAAKKKPNLSVYSVEPSQSAFVSSLSADVCVGNFGIATQQSFRLDLKYCIQAKPGPNGTTVCGSYERIQDTQGQPVSKTIQGMAKYRTVCYKLSGHAPKLLKVQPVGNVQAVVDATQAVTEGDEKDNTVTLDVKFSSEVDLSVSRLEWLPSSKTCGAAGDTLSYLLCVKNVGQHNLEKSFRVDVYDAESPSTYKSLTPAHSLSFVFSTVKPLKAGQEVCSSSLSTPPTLKVTSSNLKQRHLVAWIEHTDKNSYGSNNSKAIPYQVVSASQPDLQITSIRWKNKKEGESLDAKPSQKVTLELCFTNYGAAFSAPFSVGLYDSTFSTLLPQLSSKLASFSLTGWTVQNVCKEQCKTQDVLIPANAATGKRYIHAWLDHEEKVTEADESNNTKRLLVNVDTKLPNLVVYRVQGCANFGGMKIGDRCTYKVSVRNTELTAVQGSFSISALYTGPFSTLVRKRLLAKKTYSKGISSNSSVLLDFAVTIEPFFLPGQGTVEFVVDDANQVTESNEEDNTYSRGILIQPFAQPDLAIQSVQYPSLWSLKPGASLSFTVGLQNIGSSGVTKPFSVVFVYSKDRDIDPSDTVLVKREFKDTTELAKFAKGAGVVQEILSVKLPSSLKPGGSHFLGIIVNPNAQFSEEKEDNNIKSFNMRFQRPNLIVQRIVLAQAKVYRANDTVQVKVWFRNTGALDVTNPFRIGLFGPYQPGDTTLAKLAEVEVKSASELAQLRANSMVLTRVLSAKLPSTLVAGSSWLQVKLYEGPQVPTTVEASKTKTVKVLHDASDVTGTLTLKQPVLPVPVSQGAVQYDAQVCLRNVGSLDVQKTFRIVLEEGRVGHSSLKQAASQVYTTLDKLKAGQQDCISIKFSLSLSDQEKQTGRVLRLRLDSENTLTEQDETNNTFQLRYFYAPPSSLAQANLGIVSVALSKTVLTQQTKFGVSLKLGNFGATIPASRTFRLALFYQYEVGVGISTPSFKRVMVYEFPAWKGFTGNVMQDVKVTGLTLPFVNPEGRSFLVAELDYQQHVTETTRDDNTYSIPIQVLEDKDKDGVPSSLDCDDLNTITHPSYAADGVSAAKEICDGRDNNCDGQVDEGFTGLGSPCADGIGACRVKGSMVCTRDGTGTQCSVQATQPKAETCNGKDDDCDGLKDNGVDDSCSNGEICVRAACRILRCGNSNHCPDKRFCLAGTCMPLPSCSQDSDCKQSYSCVNRWCVAPACSTSADCPKSHLCLRNRCVLACKADSDCPFASTCRHGRCFQRCSSRNDCFRTHVCKEKLCQPLCTPPCSSGLLCVKVACGEQGCQTTCKEDSCYELGCAKGMRCSGGQCVADPCFGVTCSDGEFCRGGSCIASCSGVSCHQTEVCVDGRCQNNPCFHKACEAGKVCVFGACVLDKCTSKSCGVGRVCQVDQCVDNPCAAMQCPAGQKCIPSYGGQCVSSSWTPLEAGPQETMEQEAPSEGPDTSSQEFLEDAGVTDAQAPEKVMTEKVATVEEERHPTESQPREVSVDYLPEQVGNGIGCGCSSSGLFDFERLGWILLLLVLVFLACARFRFTRYGPFARNF